MLNFVNIIYIILLLTISRQKIIFLNVFYLQKYFKMLQFTVISIRQLTMKLLALALFIFFICINITTAEKCEQPFNCTGIICPEILCIIGAIRIEWGSGRCGCCPRCLVPGGKKTKSFSLSLC